MDRFSKVLGTKNRYISQLAYAIWLKSHSGGTITFIIRNMGQIIQNNTETTIWQKEINTHGCLLQFEKYHLIDDQTE